MLSRRQDYTRKLTERPRAILKDIGVGIEYNHELLATILVVEDTELEQRIKTIYLKDKYTLRVLNDSGILKELATDFAIDHQGLLRFKGLVYILLGIRRDFVRE